MGILDNTLITIERPKCKVVSPEKIKKEMKVKNPSFIIGLASTAINDSYRAIETFGGINPDKTFGDRNKIINSMGEIIKASAVANKTPKAPRKNDGMSR